MPPAASSGRGEEEEEEEEVSQGQQGAGSGAGGDRRGFTWRHRDTRSAGVAPKPLPSIISTDFKEVPGLAQ